MEQCSASTNCPDKNLTLAITEDHRCASTPLTFTSNAENSRHLWDFGDGQTINTDESNQAQQTYMATGEYTVTLVTIDNQDCRDTISQLLNITAPVTDFIYTVAGNSISVVADTSNAPFVNNYIWRFGDGATASSLLPNTIYTYRNPGTCLLYTSPSPRDLSTSRMPSSA